MTEYKSAPHEKCRALFEQLYDPDSLFSALGGRSAGALPDVMSGLEWFTSDPPEELLQEGPRRGIALGHAIQPDSSFSHGLNQPQGREFLECAVDAHQHDPAFLGDLGRSEGTRGLAQDTKNAESCGAGDEVLQGRVLVGAAAHLSVPNWLGACRDQIESGRIAVPFVGQRRGGRDEGVVSSDCALHGGISVDGEGCGRLRPTDGTATKE